MEYDKGMQINCKLQFKHSMYSVAALSQQLQILTSRTELTKLDMQVLRRDNVGLNDLSLRS